MLISSTPVLLLIWTLSTKAAIAELSHVITNLWWSKKSTCSFSHCSDNDNCYHMKTSWPLLLQIIHWHDAECYLIHLWKSESTYYKSSFTTTLYANSDDFPLLHYLWIFNVRSSTNSPSNKYARFHLIILLPNHGKTCFAMSHHGQRHNISQINK